MQINNTPYLKECIKSLILFLANAQTVETQVISISNVIQIARCGAVPAFAGNYLHF